MPPINSLVILQPRHQVLHKYSENIPGLWRHTQQRKADVASSGSHVIMYEFQSSSQWPTHVSSQSGSSRTIIIKQLSTKRLNKPQKHKLSIDFYDIPYSPTGRPVWSTVSQYSASMRSLLGFSSQALISVTYCRQSIMWRGRSVMPSIRVRNNSVSGPFWVKKYRPRTGQGMGTGGFTKSMQQKYIVSVLHRHFYIYTVTVALL